MLGEGLANCRRLRHVDDLMRGTKDSNPAQKAEDDCRYFENKMAGGREQMTKRIDKIDDRIRKLEMKAE